MARFVLEIGAEEVPARFLASAEEALVKTVEENLRAANLGFDKIAAMSTPRRLVLTVDGLPELQPETETVIAGPPVAIAYDAAGAPTKALTGFAAANQIAPGAVFRQKTDKGEYIVCRKKSGGLPTRDALAAMLPQIITGLPFAKRMRWGSHDTQYARPLRWILALLDDQVVPFTVGPVASGRQTMGHRVHGPGPFEVGRSQDYEKVAADNCRITVDPKQRRELIMTTGNELASAAGGKALWKDSLLEEVCGLVEHPVPLLADFDPSYLEIPAEVLLTSMETHQKSFGVAGPDGKLLPHFLTVLNLTPTDAAVVKKGWERVLRARLEDARFFWRADLGAKFDDWLARLDQVIFIGPLGSMGEKSRRLAQLCEWLAWRLAPENLEPAKAARAGLLAKADLVSAMVGEFDTLQGIMGGIYAEKAGEAPEVARALQEQYLPAGPDSPLPTTPAGAILSIADKADTLAGCFGLNMIPTGAADPNGLRRCALGIIRILIDRDWRLNTNDLFARAAELYGDRKWKLDKAEAAARLQEFFQERLRRYFMSRGYDTLLVDAVIAADASNPADAKARLDAMAAFATSGQFLQAAQTLKRVENMGRKAETRSCDYREDLLSDAAEKELGACLAALLPKLDAQISKGEYQQALASLTELAQPVGKFFDEVLVLCDAEDLKANRLKLLNAIGSRFGKIAQFSLLQV
ncbi:MAG: glycine--tRNA ligase subunit beta [Desulfovibrio sp.]|nr:glycine--tRNA ligase subunit beta [Desulfovibrio sp.]